MTLKRTLLTVATLTAGLLAPGLAAAQNVDGAFQLGLETGFLTHSSYSIEVDTGPVDIDLDRTQTRWGVAEQDVSVVLGYGLTSDLVLAGALQLGGSSDELDYDGGGDTDSSTTTIGLAPRIEYMFLPGNTVRPFVRGELFLRHSSTDNDGADSSLTALGLGGGGGIRWFAAPELSFDATLGLRLATVSGSVEAAGDDDDISGTGWGVGIGIGVAGWL